MEITTEEAKELIAKNIKDLAIVLTPDTTIDEAEEIMKFSKEKGFQFISEHIAHHRGQALVSLRMQGIKAPPYRLY